MKSTKSTIHDALLLTLNLHWRGTKNEEKAVANFAAVEVILSPTFDVAKVDGKVVSKLIDQWKTHGLSNGSVNRKLSALGKVLQTAHRAGMRKDPPPSGLRLKEAAGRTRILSPDEIAQMDSWLWQNARNSCNLFRFLLETGARVGEALALEASDVHLEARSVLIRRSKNDMPRSIPIVEALLPTLDLILRPRSGYALTGSAPVFEVSQRSFNSDWVRARTELGIADDPEFVPHALRHTCASRLVSAGVPLAVVQKWLGHKSITMTMRYAHLGDASLAAAAETLNRVRSSEETR